MKVSPSKSNFYMSDGKRFGTQELRDKLKQYYAELDRYWESVFTSGLSDRVPRVSFSEDC